MPLPHLRGLWLHIAIPVFAFVAAGSLVIVWWLHTQSQRESRTLFATVAETNAALIRSAKLPVDATTAAGLGRALNMEVFFRRSAWNIRTAPAGDMAVRPVMELVPRPTGDLADHIQLLHRIDPVEGVLHAGRNHEVVAVKVDEDATLILARLLHPPTALLLNPATLGLLALFWLLSLGLAWVITQGVVRPLQLLTEYLPQIGSDSRTMPPGVERRDEIGQLARAYLATRSQLKDERTRREESERLALLGRMATGLAHEIHNPLAAIRLHAQLLDSAPGDEFVKTARETLPVLLDETGRIEGLVNQWMFLAKPAPPQTSRTDLSELVAEVIRTHRAIARHARVVIESEIQPNLYAEVDARRITQAVRNVVMNAIHAMPGGGTLKVDAERFGGNIRVTFSDTGPGLSPAALARHAELFYSEKEGGMGIGLSVSTEILKAHRGVLAVANGADGGARVTFLIPAAA
jgi:signal transduction histidine kinase